jgi:hypothetical protein
MEGQILYMVRMMPFSTFLSNFKKWSFDTLLEKNQVNTAILGPPLRGFLGGLGFGLVQAHGLQTVAGDPLGLQIIEYRLARRSPSFML